MAGDLPKTGWTVLGQQETMGRLPDGSVGDGIEVSFQLGDKGTFTVFLPKAKYSPANVQAAIAAYAATLTQVHGLTG